MSKVAVIDYGMGNLHSVAKALEFVARTANLSVEVVVTADPKIIDSADRVIFPGVGAIRDCMAEILRLNIDHIVREAVKTKPLLAICVGMQALMQRSEENHGVDCLGILPGRVRHFGVDLRDTPVVKLEGERSGGERLKVPHMGWNCVSQTRQHPLWQDIPDQSRFYFVHSYYVETGKPDQVMGTTSYGVDFCAALSDGNIFAVQFHPEKSQTAGLALLRNFLVWDGAR